MCLVAPPSLNPAATSLPAPTPLITPLPLVAPPPPSSCSSASLCTPSLVPLVRLVVASGLITNLATGDVAGVDRPGKASV